MADTSERIIILSAVVLVIIILISNSKLKPTIVEVSDLNVEINISKDFCILGETITATLYFENNGTKDVWVNPPDEIAFIGRSINDPEQNTDVIFFDWLHADESAIPMPAGSKIGFYERDYKPKFTGEFIISCLGNNKTVLILDPPSESETVIAMMNKHSFQSTDDATLFIANVGPNLITCGSLYTIEREVDQDWIEVSPFPPNSAWTAEQRLLRPDRTSSQRIWIDTLESGLYRVSKTFEDSVTEESITLIVEFEIWG